MDDPHVLLTNDDGADSPGLAALRERLGDVGEVTVVAPNDDQSAVGRAISESVRVHEADGGYAVEGTPADCVVAGLEVLAPDADVVVAGCNYGANIGAVTMGRSGTVSAAVEAAFFDVPAIAVSQYVSVPEDVTFGEKDVDRSAYDRAADLTAHLVSHAGDNGTFEGCDLLNVNLPDPGAPLEGVRLTEPGSAHEMAASRDGEDVVLTDRIWERMGAGEAVDPPGTDRHAVVEGYASVTPLWATHASASVDGLADVLADFDADA
jgi:5'-nucleotidase